MRLDKFLKNTKIVKRRVMAHDLCVNGKVLKDNKELKPSYIVKNGDVIIIKLGKKILTTKVVEDSNLEIIEEKMITEN